MNTKKRGLQQENIVKVRKGERDVVRRAMDCPVMGKRNKGRQPRRWKDWVEARMKELGVGREDALDRKRWRGIIAADPSGEGRGWWQRSNDGASIVSERRFCVMELLHLRIRGSFYFVLVAHARRAYVCIYGLSSAQLWLEAKCETLTTPAPVRLMR